MCAQEPGRPTERYEEFVCTSRAFKALVRPRHSSGLDTLVTINFRRALSTRFVHACTPAQHPGAWVQEG